MDQSEITINQIIDEAESFCLKNKNVIVPELNGVTDGKKIGTWAEQQLSKQIENKYGVKIFASSSKGIDIPLPHLLTDLKTTKHSQPQSSSPFRDISQKVYGLGHNLLLLTYEIVKIEGQTCLNFITSVFIPKEKTGDAKLTSKLLAIGDNLEAILKLLHKSDIPGNEDDLLKLAERILKDPPQQGCLTISNALQWRCQYKKVIKQKMNYFELEEKKEACRTRRIRVIIPIEKMKKAVEIAKSRNVKECKFGAMTYGSKLTGIRAHLIGIMAEEAVAHYFGQKIDEKIFENHGDEGIDLENVPGFGVVGVKSTTYEHEPYMRVEVEHFSEKVDNYILCYVNEKLEKMEVWLIGWASRKEIMSAKKKRFRIGNDYGPMNYVLEEHELNGFMTS